MKQTEEGKEEEEDEMELEVNTVLNIGRRERGDWTRQRKTKGNN